MAANDGLQQIIQDEIKGYLSDPTNLPDELLQWLPNYLSVYPPQLQNTQLIGGTLTPGDGSPHNISWGFDVFTWAGTLVTATQTISHGLGVVPVAIIAIPSVPTSGLNFFPTIAVDATPTSTQVTFQAGTVDGQVPVASSTCHFYWLVIA